MIKSLSPLISFLLSPKLLGKVIIKRLLLTLILGQVEKKKKREKKKKEKKLGGKSTEKNVSCPLTGHTFEPHTVIYSSFSHSSQ